MNGCETPYYGRDKAAEDTTRDTTTARINRAVICDKGSGRARRVE